MKTWKIEEICPIAVQIVQAITPLTERCVLAGSIRREMRHVRDIDIVLIPKEDSWRTIVSTIGEIVKGGKKSARIKHISGAIVDVYKATEGNWGAVLLWRTGSSQHNIELAQIAQKCGLQLKSGTGLFRNGELITGRTEHEIYEVLAKYTDDFVTYETPQSRFINWEVVFTSYEEYIEARKQFYEFLHNIGFPQETWKAKFNKHIERLSRDERLGTWEKRAWGMSFQEYLKIRRQILERDGFKCRDCGTKGHFHLNPLEVHNLTQGKIHKVETCLTLCRKCHCEREGRKFFIPRYMRSR